MIRLSKMTQHAIAAVSRLAEVYQDSDAWLSSGDIASSRNLSKPVVAKMLSLLAQAGVVVGSPGPGGGYRLARSPAEISLWDASAPFERDLQTQCPYGPGWCGVGEPCPLHDSLVAIQRIGEDYLRNTRFDVFARRPNGRRPVPKPAAAARGRRSR